MVHVNRTRAHFPPNLSKLTCRVVAIIPPTYLINPGQFAENQLSGPLPDEIKYMGNLKTFSVHNNDPGTGAHNGTLPHFSSHPYLNEL